MRYSLRNQIGMRGGVACLLLLVLAIVSVVSADRWTNDTGEALSAAEAAELYGAACSGWDDIGDGCGSGGCATACRSYQPDGNWWYTKYGSLSSTYCSGSQMTCGRYEDVDQTACNNS